MPAPELGQVDVVEVIHMDGSRGVARLKTIAIVPIPEEPEPQPATPAEPQGGPDAGQ